MNAQEIINSGKLELYVSGALPKDEIPEIEKAISEFDEVKKEVENIEIAIIRLAQNVAPPLSGMLWAYILNTIKKVKTLKQPKSNSYNWLAISGWAATILCIGGIFWMLKDNSKFKNQIQVTTTENRILKEEVLNAAELLEILRSKDYQTIILPGNQAVAPKAFAKVYYNKNENVAYFDAKGLPTPPPGKVYQVWSLIMDPLTPSSMGLMAAVPAIENGIYKFEGFPAPEAFGITLEPQGGSDTPTLSQLYALGMLPI